MAHLGRRTAFIMHVGTPIGAIVSIQRPCVYIFNFDHFHCYFVAKCGNVCIQRNFKFIILLDSNFYRSVTRNIKSNSCKVSSVLSDTLMALLQINSYELEENGVLFQI